MHIHTYMHIYAIYTYICNIFCQRGESFPLPFCLLIEVLSIKLTKDKLTGEKTKSIHMCIRVHQKSGLLNN